MCLNIFGRLQNHFQVLELSKNENKKKPPFALPKSLYVPLQFSVITTPNIKNIKDRG